MPHDNSFGQISTKALRCVWSGASAKYIDERTPGSKSERSIDDILTACRRWAPHAYEIFSKKEDNCVKVVMKP
jgi:hypothetical protein